MYYVDIDKWAMDFNKTFPANREKLTDPAKILEQYWLLDGPTRNSDKRWISAAKNTARGYVGRGYGAQDTSWRKTTGYDAGDSICLSSHIASQSFNQRWKTLFQLFRARKSIGADTESHKKRAFDSLIYWTASDNENAVPEKAIEE